METKELLMHAGFLTVNDSLSRSTVISSGQYLKKKHKMSISTFVIASAEIKLAADRSKKLLLRRWGHRQNSSMAFEYFFIIMYSFVK